MASRKREERGAGAGAVRGRAGAGAVRAGAVSGGGQCLGLCSRGDQNAMGAAVTVFDPCYEYQGPGTVVDRDRRSI
eukprot:SAG31_NODE_461_length_15359_cov_8.989253_6_plen_76_part_00